MHVDLGGSRPGKPRWDEGKEPGHGGTQGALTDGASA